MATDNAVSALGKILEFHRWVGPSQQLPCVQQEKVETALLCLPTNSCCFANANRTAEAQGQSSRQLQAQNVVHKMSRHHGFTAHCLRCWCCYALLCPYPQ
jgi:predicted nucleic acid binding AN1-type Zn finger protein